MNDDELAGLRNMADQWACQKLQERYWYAEATRNADDILSVFTEDARYGSVQGKAEIRKTIDKYMGELMTPVAENYHIVPIVVNIDVNGDHAAGDIRGVGFIRVTEAGSNDKMLVMGIGYRNEFTRTSDGWRISAMRGIESGFTIAHDTTWQFVAECSPAIFAAAH